jgi:excisionase family DNA binding protein
MNPQRTLTLDDANGYAPLVTMEAVRCRFNIHADQVNAWIDEGRFNWVWDVSVGTGKVRELRIWTRHYLTGGPALDVTADDVVEAVIGTHKERLRSAEVANLLVVADPTVLRLVRAKELAGPLVGHTQWITRESLAGFLKRRLLNQ